MNIYQKLGISVNLCASVLLWTACSSDTVEQIPQQGVLSFTTSVERFDGETVTRTSIEGKAFETGDKIKLKLICPDATNRTQLGESTYSGSFDGFYLLKWNTDSTKWLTLTSNDGYDINGDYSPSASPDIYKTYLAQPTRYVFTAQTWSEEQIFIANGTRVEQYSNVFHADQSREADYKASDFMWAQTIMQTGSYNVHLSFKHVMAALKITVDGFGDLTENDVLTIEGMPDIDQREVIVGDSYAKDSRVNVDNFGYKSKHQCEVENNGQVIGVANITSSGATCVPITVNESATYTAYRSGNEFRLIIPPCTLGAATIWLRHGDKRYSMTLSEIGNPKTFKAGTLYHVIMKKKND